MYLNFLGIQKKMVKKMAKRLLVANSKGGVGKSTVAINTADLLNEKGYKVLLVDTDAQGHCSIALGKNPLKYYNTIFELLKEEAGINECIHTLYENLDILPSNLNLFDIDEVLSVRKKLTPHFALQKNLKLVDDLYDYIVIDSPPNLGMMAYNAIIASDFIIIPVDSSFLGLEGYIRINSTIKKNIIPDIGREIKEKILLTMYDRRTKLSKQVEAAITNRYGEESIFKTYINRNTDIQKSTAQGLSIRKFSSKVKHTPQGYTDFKFFVSELLSNLTEDEAIG